MLFACSLVLPAEQTKPQRIVALAPHIAEMLFAVGAGSQVVAVSDYSDYPAAAAALPRVASFAGVNIEAVLALQPDLVIAWRSGTPQADVQRLTQLGLNVAFSDPHTLDDIATELELMGTLSGNPRRAAEQATAFASALHDLKLQYQHKKRVNVFFAMGTAPLSTVANNAWPQHMLSLCGAENLFSGVKGDYPQVGIEQVLAAAPEVIIQAKRPESPEDFSFWQSFTAIPAVKAQRFISVNADYLFRTTPRTLLGIQQLCQALDNYR